LDHRTFVAAGYRAEKLVCTVAGTVIYAPLDVLYESEVVAVVVRELSHPAANRNNAAAAINFKRFIIVNFNIKNGLSSLTKCSEFGANGSSLFYTLKECAKIFIENIIVEITRQFGLKFHHKKATAVRAVAWVLLQKENYFLSDTCKISGAVM